MKYDPQATHHFFFGDETSLRLFNGYKELVLNDEKEYFGVLEVSDGDGSSLQAINLFLDTVPYSPDEPGVNAIGWMEDMHPDCWSTWKKAVFYLAGCPQAVEKFKTYLYRNGVAENQIQCRHN